MTARVDAWWKRGVIYQVYPRSFQDSNGDGIGDLRGIAHRLDYLAWLGVDAVWISPFYPSPMADFGYDVANYCDVDPVFGTLADFDTLVEKAHSLGLKIILDLVPNHTSDQHPWFTESRSSRANPKRDWYIWRDAASGGGPPNNWISDFGGPAWSWDMSTGQYYSHAFLPQQPDLNWRNPAVREAMHDVMRFWLSRGADGFRIDVLWHLIKHADFIDNPPNHAYTPRLGEMHKVLQTHSTDQPEMQDVMRGLRQASDAFPSSVMLGEIYLPIDRLVTYYGEQGAGVHLPLNFHLIETPWRAGAIADLIATYERALPDGAWPNWVIGNHDRPRIATRLGERQARVAAMLMLTLRGTPTLYYGDELGLADVPIPPDRVKDPRELRQPGKGLNRDPVRTPMPWNGSEGAGFSSAESWLPLNEDYQARNAAAQLDDPHSILSLYRALLTLRRARPSLNAGEISKVSAENGVLTYERTYRSERSLICLNMTDREQPGCPEGDILLSTEMKIRPGRVLHPGEGVIVGLRQSG
jgi:alpha-glucosidase